MNRDTPYTIQLPVYEGPLDLLLELIEQAELDITKVALAQVTDQYLAYLKKIPEHQLDDLVSFLLIAARLLQIKSEALLPRAPVREPGEEDMGDALARQLIAYKKYKQIAVHLADRSDSGLRTYLRLSTTPTLESKLDMSGVNLADLRLAFMEALADAPATPEPGKVVVAQRVRLRDRIQIIITALRKTGRTTFQKIFKQARSKLEVIVSFLAVLELIKQNLVKVEQDTLFGEIELSPGDAWQADQEMDFELEFDE
jgi:segregation and condensation protein A